MEENDIKKRFDEAEEKINLLKRQRKNTEMSIRTFLTLASQIRDCISNDRDVKLFCDSHVDFAQRRKKLLDDIRKFQMDVIIETIKKDEDISFSNCSVVNFDKAKVALSDLADKELASNPFLETEEPPLFASIEECKTHINTLKRVSHNCKYGKYKVLIMGDFQSGKSTTLDAFCEGRHISAIGKGAATSAVLVSVTYSEKESISIHWKQKKQFSSLFDKIKQYIQDFDWQSFDLDSQNSRHKLFDAIEHLRNSSFCPNIGDGDAKFLMLCSFVLAFYGSKELQDKKLSLQDATDIADITKFPDNGESKWEKSGIEKFSIDETIFIFIDQVECFIPSKILKELNCTIVDSPGLFNSSYDTMVTETAMKDAHAIMYILPYHKGIGMEVCRSLYTIKDNYSDVHRKLFIVNNLVITDDNEFYDSNCRQIESMFGAEKHVYQYDGKLSYLILLYMLYISGQASEKDYKYLMSVTQRGLGPKKKKVFDNFPDAWAYHTKKYEMNEESLEEMLEICGFKALNSALKKFIADNESHAVIISNGVEPLRNEMLSVEEELSISYIEPYLSTHDKLVELWNKRIGTANDFQKHVREEANEKIFGHDEFSNSLCDRMAEDVYSKLFTYDFYTRLTEEISGVLYDHKSSLLATKTLFKSDKTKFKKRFSELSYPWIRDKVIELVSSKMEYLADNMEREQDKTIGNMFAPVIDNLEKELKDYWNSKFGDGKGLSMKNYLTLSRYLKPSTKKAGSQSPSNELSKNDVSGALLGGLIVEVSTIIAGIASMITGYITAILCDPFGVSQTIAFILAVLLGIGGTILVAFAPDYIRNKFIKILSEKLDSEVRKNAHAGFSEIVKTYLRNTLNEYIEKLTVNINKLKSERDLALNPNPNQESLCFRATETYIHVHSQIVIYDEFKKDYLIDE